MDKDLVKRVCLARCLYELASDCLRARDDIRLYAAVNLMQDAVEAFLIACCDQLGVLTDAKMPFDKYIDAINTRIAPQALPSKARLIRLNTARVASKHHGIQPDRAECERFAVHVRDFFEEVSQSVLGVNFFTLSAFDLLTPGEAKRELEQASAHFERGDYYAAALGCRKAIYLEIESHYDISSFADGAKPSLLGPLSKAPYYAKNADYIRKNVGEPTSYIVLDHAEVDRELLKYGVDTADFWNLWRLTPAVFRKADGNWVARESLEHMSALTNRDLVGYILSTALSIVLAIHSSRKRTRNRGVGFSVVTLKENSVHVFEKADPSSPSKLIVLDEPKFVVMSRVEGLNDTLTYWQGFANPAGDPFVTGYVRDCDVVPDSLRSV